MSVLRSERAKQRTRKYAHVKRHTARVKHIQAGGAVAEPVLLARVVELGRRRQLKKLLAELELQRPQRPSVRVFNAAVHACCRCGALDRAFELLYYMEVWVSYVRAVYNLEKRMDHTTTGLTQYALFCRKRCAAESLQLLDPLGVSPAIRV